MKAAATILFSLVASAALILVPAAADPDVSPSPHESAVRLEGIKRDDPFRPSTPRPATEIAAPSTGGRAPSPPSSGREPTYCERQNFQGVRCARLTPINMPGAGLGADVPAPPPPRREATPGEIRRAVREIEMPALGITVQPGGRTLVNVATIFHTQPRAVNRTVDMLGNEVEVEATATSFTWHHGDGTSATTTSPGAPYPSKDVTHTYRRTADALRPRVDTTYTVRYRVDGGAWTDLGAPLTATGTPTTLEVRQAAPVLVRP